MLKQVIIAPLPKLALLIEAAVGKKPEAYLQFYPARPELAEIARYVRGFP